MRSLVRQAVANDEHWKIVGGLPAPEEIPAAALQRRPLPVLPGQGREALPNRWQRRHGLEKGVRVGVLRLDESAGVGRRLILEPSIRIDELDAVQRLLEIVAASRGGTRYGGVLRALRPTIGDKAAQRTNASSGREEVTANSLY